LSESTPLQRWPAEAIWQAVVPQLPGFSVEILPEVDSTNTELMRRAKEGRPDPILLIAERQLAGRGRQGRAWVGELGDALTFSIAERAHSHGRGR
jgi:BirA family biotin operon repressor/biotin-[acetyl-CoA-carboxylase] ligase